MSHNTVPGLEVKKAKKAIEKLEGRLVGMIDLQLTLKHIHWNVIGMSFIGVHEMLDNQVEPVREMTDAIAERIAILGGTPNGTPGNVVETRDWDDYPIGRATVPEHLEALDSVYDGIIADHRKVAAAMTEIDPVTEDLLIGQLGQLELFQWFVRSHIESTGAGSKS